MGDPEPLLKGTCMEGFAAHYAPCGLVELRLDGSIVDANDSFVEWAGTPLSELSGRKLTDLIQDAELAETTAAMAEDQRTGPEGARSLTVQLLRADGSSRPVLISWRREGERVMAALFDATNRDRFEARVSRAQTLAQRQEQRLNLLLHSAVEFADAMTFENLAESLARVAVDAYTSTTAAVFLVDKGAQITVAAGSSPILDDARGKALGEQAMQLRSVMAFADIADAPSIPRAVVEFLQAQNVHGMLVAPIRHETRQFGLLAVFFDQPRHFDLEAAPLADALTRQAGQVLARIELTSHLHRAAMLDETTGLPNRRLFEEQVHRATQSEELVGVAFIDLDGFKAVNDTLGHDAGDLILQEVAVRIQSVVRGQDSVARYGGDEFVAVWNVKTIEDAHGVAERIRAALSDPFDLPAGLPIHASIGLVVSSAHPEPQVAERLVRVADQAMYEAKAAGGDQVVLKAV